MDRRAAIKWVMALAAVPLVDWSTLKIMGGPSGTLSDPDLLNPVVPWNKILTKDELSTLAVLCDVILPADEHSPSSSSLNVHDFIDEWVSAPYPQQLEDLKTVRGGIVWLDADSKKRFQKQFAELTEPQRSQICDDICYLPKAKVDYKQGAVFFALVRDLSTSAFYTTKQGMDDIQYKGNIPLSTFTGPPPHVLAHLGLN
jgi:gluconate 2-dehydrogenase gamma chain